MTTTILCFGSIYKKLTIFLVPEDRSYVLGQITMASTGYDACDRSFKTLFMLLFLISIDFRTSFGSSYTPIFIMVWDIIRNSTFGYLVQLASRGKYFQYAEERDPSLLKQFINEDKSLNIRHHGNTNAPDDESEPRHNERSSRTQLHEDKTTYSQHNESYRTPVDPGKGKDNNVIDWFYPADPDNPRN